MIRTNYLQAIAYHTLDLLTIENALLDDNETAFIVWPRSNRAVVIFDPEVIRLNKVNDKFAHDLSTRLRGPLVVRTNTRGLFLQVDYDVQPAPIELQEKPLNLDDQPSPFHMPIGHTQRDDLWISLLDGDSFLLGGSRGLGKSALLHGGIQALLHGGSTQVYGWDGKEGEEYLRYADHPNFHFLNSLTDGLRDILQESKKRHELLIGSGHPNVASYNKNAEEPIMPIALFVDEAKRVIEQEPEAVPLLVEIVEKMRSRGIYPILATNNPEQASLLVKTNLVTRICLPVPSWNASQMVLGGKGARADQLPKIRGRGLLEWGGRIIEFQAFHITYPEPTEAALKFLQTMKTRSTVIQPDEISKLAESIRSQWTPEMSKRSVGRLLGLSYAGSYVEKIDKVIDYLSATTTTSNPKTHEIGLSQA